MGNKLKYLVFLISIVSIHTSCEKVFLMGSSSNDPKDNFNALSKVIKEKYSYLGYKNIDWDYIVDTSSANVKANMGVFDEFDLYSRMLYTLKDGHVNLYSGFDVSRNWNWYLAHPVNFDRNVIERHYLGEDYFISGGLRHRILTSSNKLYGYVYYSSFSSGMSYIEFVKAYFAHNKVEGIIIDVRDNGGGYLQNAIDFASAFTDKKRVGFIEYYKSGPEIDNFDGPFNRYIKPKGETWTKPIVVLTNRKCYSSTSFFVTMMKELPNVTVLGDKTGGGAGLPVDYILPNEWYLRYSGSKCQSSSGVDFEYGVEPHIKADLDTILIKVGIDSYIERAKTLIDQY
jgi:hypothetical protein